MMQWFADFSSWLARTGVRGGRSARSVEAYLQDVRQFAGWFARETETVFVPACLNGPDLRAWRAYSLHRERVSAATWNRRRISLKLFCRWATESGQVLANPFEGVQPARVEQGAILWLDDRQFAALRRVLEKEVNAAQTPAKRLNALRDRALVALMLYAGLRVGAAVGIRAEDLTLGERSGAVLVSAGAGKGSKERKVPLNVEARRALRAWMDAAGIREGRLFAMTTRTAQRRIGSLGALAGISALTPHRLRHTFVKRALDGRYSRDGLPVPLQVVRRLAGHASVAMTARYAEPSQAELAAALGA